MLEADPRLHFIVNRISSLAFIPHGAIIMARDVGQDAEVADEVRKGVPPSSKEHTRRADRRRERLPGAHAIGSEWLLESDTTSSGSN